MTKTVNQTGNMIYVDCLLCDKHWVQNTVKTTQKILTLHYKVSHPQAPPPVFSLFSKKCNNINQGEGLRQIVAQHNAGIR